MSDFLADMTALSRERAEGLPANRPAAELDRPVFPLSLDRFDLIAEIKERSPAEGRLAQAGEDRLQRVAAYADGGAAAVSVLTEPSRFDGSLDHLSAVAEELSARELPVMRKDFLVDPRQVTEAKACGASAVLLIAAMLDDNELAALLDCAFELNLFVLLEAFDAADLARSAALVERQHYANRAEAGQLLVGVNTRNLRTLAVDATRLERLAAALPPGVLAVAESGIRTADDAARVGRLGYRLGLVGTALMQSDDPAGSIAAMLDAARRGEAD